MAREIVGLKIGASQLTAAHVSSNGKSSLLGVGSAPVTPGVVAGGEVRDADTLAGNLNELFSQTKLPKKAVRIGLASNRIGVRTVEIEGVTDPKQLGNAIRFRAQEALPIPLHEAILDFQVLAREHGEDGQPKHRVQFVVAYRDLVNGFVDACHKAEIKLVGVDLDAFALLRVLSPLGPRAEGIDVGAVVAVSTGAERSTIAVSDGLICEFTRVLDWGGATLTSAVANELDIDLEDAERIKQIVGLEGDVVLDGLDDERTRLARDAISKSVEGFARELVASRQFYQSQPGSHGIGEVLLAGGSARLSGLAQALERMVGVGVRLGDPLANVAGVRKGLHIEEDPSLAVAVGLGLGI